MIRVVPFFMEDGYFTRVAIPRVLEADQRIRLCPPVGTHDGISRIVMAQAQLACASSGLVCGETVVLLVGHGSASAPGRALALHRHAATVAAARLFAKSEAACLEEPPLLADALRGLRAHPVIVLGFFAGAGMHVRDDVPAAIAAEQGDRGPGGHPVRFHGCVTDDPAMAQIILDQAGASDFRRE
jgi:sirohydrochlorin ferrochelatase